MIFNSEYWIIISEKCVRKYERLVDLLTIKQDVKNKEYIKKRR